MGKIVCLQICILNEHINRCWYSSFGLNWQTFYINRESTCSIEPEKKSIKVGNWEFIPMIIVFLSFLYFPLCSILSLKSVTCARRMYNKWFIVTTILNVCLGGNCFPLYSLLDVTIITSHIHYAWSCMANIKASNQRKTILPVFFSRLAGRIVNVNFFFIPPYKANVALSMCL